MLTHNLMSILLLGGLCGIPGANELGLPPFELSKNPNLRAADSYDFAVLPSEVQDAVSLLADDTLINVLELAVTSTEIFGQVVLYLTLSWAETACEWINAISGLVEDGWEYFSSGQVVDDAVDVFEDVAETAGDVGEALCFWCDDMDIMPDELKKELIYLTKIKKDRKLAILKYTAWKVNGIIWNDEFTEKLGFKNDKELMSALVSGLKTLYKESVSANNNNNNNNNNQDPWNKEDIDVDLDCDLVDPVELINPHYVSTINILSDFLTAINYADTAIAITFAAEVCVSYVVGGCIGGGLGFAIDGHGNGIIYETGYGSISVSTSTPDVDANFVVTLGIFKDLSSVEGFSLSAGIGANFPAFGANIGISTAEGSDGDWSPIAVNFAASFDLTGSEYQFSVSISLSAESTTGIAHLYSSECAVNAGGGGNWDDLITNNYPKIGPSTNEHYHIYGGSTGNALITVSKNYKNLKETIEYKQEHQIITSSHNKQQQHYYTNNYFILSTLIIIIIIIIGVICSYFRLKKNNNNCFNKKNIKNRILTEEHQPLISYKNYQTI